MTKLSRTAPGLLGILLSSILAVVPAAAQTYQTFRAEQEDILTRARWRIGPFRILPVLMLRNVGYDNNIYSERNDDTLNPDFTASAGIQINTHLLFSNWVIFTMTEHPEYVYYGKEKRERSWNNNFSPSLKVLLFNSFALTGSYKTSKERRRASSEFDVRADERRQATRGQFFYETSRRTALGFSGSVEKITYDRISISEEDFDIGRALNRTERNVTFETYYRVFTNSQFFVSGGRTDYEFENLMTQWRNSRSTQVNTGIRFPEIGRIRGAFSLGYKKLAPVVPGKKPFSGLVGNTDVALRAGRFSFRGVYARDAVFSFDAQNIYFVDDRWRLGLSFYPIGLLRFDYDFGWGTGAYPEPIPFRDPGGEIVRILRKDRYRTHTAGLVVRVYRSIGVGMLFTYWQRTSNYHLEQRSRWFLGGYLTFEF